MQFLWSDHHVILNCKSICKRACWQQAEGVPLLCGAQQQRTIWQNRWKTISFVVKVSFNMYFVWINYSTSVKPVCHHKEEEILLEYLWNILCVTLIMSLKLIGLPLIYIVVEKILLYLINISLNIPNIYFLEENQRLDNNWRARCVYILLRNNCGDLRKWNVYSKSSLNCAYKFFTSCRWNQPESSLGACSSWRCLKYQ